MARKFQIDTPAQIGGLLEALSGITVTGNGSVTGTFSVGSTATITGKLTLTAGIAGALILDTQASGTTHAVRADRAINTAAGSGLTGGGNLTADRSLAVDFTASGGDNGVGTKVARNDHTHSTLYLGLTATAADSSKLGGVAASSYVQNTLQVIAGSGLTGGGTLAADRTLTVNFTTSGGNNGTATTVARGDHNHDATYLKLVGGTLTDNLTISRNLAELYFNRPSGAVGQYAGIETLDNGVAEGRIFWDFTNLKWVLSNNAGTNYYDLIHSGGGQTIGSTLTVSGLLTLGAQATGTGHAVRADRAINTAAGSGLTGGGNLTADRSLAVDFGTGTNQAARGDHNHDTVYAKLAGASFTGQVVITPAAGTVPLVLKGTTSYGAAIYFENTTATTGRKYSIYSEPTGGLKVGDETAAVGILSYDTTNAWQTSKNFSLTGTANLAVAGTISEGGVLLSNKYALKGSNSITAGTGLTLSGTTMSADIGTGATQVAAGNHNHDTTYLKLSGGTMTGALTLGNTSAINYNIVGTTGGWARGIHFADTTGATISGGMGLNGTASAPSLMYLSFGTSPWDVSTAKGIFIGSGGNVSINKTIQTTYALDANGSINGTALYEGGTAISTKYAAATHNHDSTYLRLNGTNTMSASIMISKDGGGVTINRPTGGTSQYAGFSIQDSATVEASLLWDYTNNKWKISSDGNTNFYDVLHSGGGQTIGGTTSLTLTGAMYSSSAYPLVSKLTGYKSWIFHHPSGNGFILAPSTSINAEDWAWTKQTVFMEDGAIRVSGGVWSPKNVGQVTFAPGETSKAFNHNLGTTSFMVAFGADNHARHVAWNTKTNTSVNITLDSPHTETINVDVIIIPYF